MTPLVVEATYENGVLRPRERLALAEGTQVRLTIDAATVEQDEHADPLAGVIGICDSGRTDGAEKHDAYIYGKLRP